MTLILTVQQGNRVVKKQGKKLIHLALLSPCHLVTI